MNTRALISQWVAFPAAFLGGMIAVNWWRGHQPLIDWVLVGMVFGAVILVRLLTAIMRRQES